MRHFKFFFASPIDKKNEQTEVVFVSVRTRRELKEEITKYANNFRSSYFGLAKRYIATMAATMWKMEKPDAKITAAISLRQHDSAFYDVAIYGHRVDAPMAARKAKKFTIDASDKYDIVAFLESVKNAKNINDVIKKLEESLIE